MEDYSIDNFTLYEYSDDYIDYPDSTYENINYHDSTYENINYPDSTYHYHKISRFIQFVATCIIICVALPLTLIVIYALCRLVRNDHVAPIYIVNLLMSNVIHLCCLIVRMTRPEIWISQAGYFMYHLILVASVWFMVCVALERYLVIACPLWYNSRRNIKNSVVVCVVVWILALLFVLILYFRVDIHYHGTVFGVFLLLPFPLFIFFLGGTLKALSASRVPSDEKRRIVGILVLVLFIFMLLFLPLIIYLLAAEARYNDIFRILSETFIRLTPLADLTLYVFMKKGTIDKLLSSVCCCRMDSSDISSSPV